MDTYLTVGLVAAALVAVSDEVPPGTETITLEPKFGTVTFSHGAHSRLEDVQCRTCHHTHAGGARPIQPCHDCHVAGHFRQAEIRPADETQSADVPGQPSKAQEAFHVLCHGCHADREDEGRPTGPTDSCRDCHV